MDLLRQHLIQPEMKVPLLQKHQLLYPQTRHHRQLTPLPPTVTLTAPSVGTVSGTVTVSASASDNVGVAGVQFRLQGANLGPEDTTSPYSTSWNTTTVPNGSYTLTAIARDAAGNTKTSASVTVTVSNTSTPPPSSALTISNLTVASGKTYVVPTSGLQAGGTVYIDRAYTFTTVPTLVQGAAYIQTANDDKAATNAAFLSFTVNQPVSVYVAHDVRLTPKPSWLSTFTDTGTNLVTVGYDPPPVCAVLPRRHHYPRRQCR